MVQSPCSCSTPLQTAVQLHSARLAAPHHTRTQQHTGNLCMQSTAGQVEINVTIEKTVRLSHIVSWPHHTHTQQHTGNLCMQSTAWQAEINVLIE